MPPVYIHQTIHGYREGHRLLSGSVPLGTDAARAMLVLSDMSGPAMRPGFEEYLTGYPLPGSEFFVFAKTWYAPEMRRPGCVWTHSFLLSRNQIGQTCASRLLSKFRRPQHEGVEGAATIPVEIDETVGGSKRDGFTDLTVAAALIGAVLGQALPVIVTVEKADRVELSFLQLWEQLWPTAKAHFSFCTGALMPRSVGGALMDLQAVPRAVPSSQFRKSAGAALVLDLHAPRTVEPWVELFLEEATRGGSTFRSWLEAAAGAEASRGVVPSLAPLFGAWHAPGSSARTALASVVGAKGLDPDARGRLVGMVFARADAESGPAGRRELLQDLSEDRANDLTPIATVIEEEVRRLFEGSRPDGVTLVLSLLGKALTPVGEGMLRAAILSLTPTDLESFGDGEAPYLPFIVGENQPLASSPVLWSRAGSQSEEVLSRLGGMNLADDERAAIVDAIISAKCDVPVDALVRFGGKAVVFRGLSAIASGHLQLSWAWRSALGGQRDTVLDWLERLSAPTLADLELGSRFVSPEHAQSRLATVWKAGTASDETFPSRVAAFGLTLAFWEGSLDSPLFAKCFQPAYDAAASSRLEYEAWEWIQEYAPSSYWWRDWDKCERLAKAIARLFEKRRASLETVFGIVHSPPAIKKIVAALDDNRDTRPYLKALRKAVASSSIGNREQRDALRDSG